MEKCQTIPTGRRFYCNVTYWIDYSTHKTILGVKWLIFACVCAKIISILLQEIRSLFFLLFCFWKSIRLNSRSSVVKVFHFILFELNENIRYIECCFSKWNFNFSNSLVIVIVDICAISFHFKLTQIWDVMIFYICHIFGTELLIKYYNCYRIRT